MQPVPKRINPQYKMILIYNIHPERQENYYRYVLGEFVPALHDRGVYMYMAWGVVYGDYPNRHVEFVTESAAALRNLLTSPEWTDMESKLQNYITDYSRKILPYKGSFQF